MSVKKLLVINYEFPPLGGGAANASSNICKEFIRKGYDLTVVTSHMKGLEKYQNIDGLEIFRLNCFRQSQDRSNFFEMSMFILSAILKIKDYTKDKNFDNCLIFFATPFGLIGLILKIFFNIPYSVFVRGGDIPGFIREINFFHFLISPLTRLIFANAKEIFANGEALTSLTNQYLSKIGNRLAINVPNGVNVSFYKENKLSAKGSSAALSLLFVGRLVQYQKNIFILPEILNGLKDKNIELVVVGDGPDKNDLEKRFEDYGVSSQVTMKGWLERDQLRETYAKADILIFPSFSEGVSNVLLEAFASGLYVIANDIPDNKKYIQEIGRGFLLSNNDLPSYLNKIIEIYSNRDLLSVSEDSYYKSLEKISWEGAVDSLVERLDN